MYRTLRPSTLTAPSFHFLGFPGKDAELAKDNSITYISPLDTMCTESYCKAIIGHKKSYPVQFDFAHLTPEGSRWFIEEVEKQVSK